MSDIISLYEDYVRAWKRGTSIHEGLQDKIDAAWNAIKAKYPHVKWNAIGDEVGAGWWGILDTLLAELDAIMELHPGYVLTVRQVKEKFGGLRFYYDLWAVGESHVYNPDRPEDPVKVALGDEIYARVRQAEDKASKTCEWCGEPGKSGGDGWIKTLCEKHHQLHKRK